MAYTQFFGTAFVAEDGSYSGGETIVAFDADELDEEQWGILEELPDSEKIVFALLCLEGKDISKYIDEYYMR